MKNDMCESCGERKGIQWVRGIGKELYCKPCALAYGKKNWVNIGYTMIKKEMITNDKGKNNEKE